MKLSLVVKSVVCKKILDGVEVWKWFKTSVQEVSCVSEARRLGRSVGSEARSESVGGSEGRARVRAVRSALAAQAQGQGRAGARSPQGRPRPCSLQGQGSRGADGMSGDECGNIALCLEFLVL